jgi:hypothetical protein
MPINRWNSHRLPNRSSVGATRIVTDDAFILAKMDVSKADSSFLSTTGRRTFCGRLDIVTWLLFQAAPRASMQTETDMAATDVKR